MFENLNWWEIGALLLLALLIFGERLPKVIGDGMRMLRGLRAMAQNATSDLNKELGTDLQLQDLHPKAFIRKHLLSEEEEDALRKPLQGLFEDVKADLNGVKAPACLIAGNDVIHTPATARKAAKLLPNSELHDDVVERRADDKLLKEWDRKEWRAAEPKIAAIFGDFLDRAERAARG